MFYLSVRFAGSSAAVARLTRNHGPLATGTFTRSGAEPPFRKRGVIIAATPLPAIIV